MTASSYQSQQATAQIARATELISELTDFTSCMEIGGYMPGHELLSDLLGSLEETLSGLMLDYFTFEWVGDDGDGNLQEFLDANPDLSDDDYDMLLTWSLSTLSVYEIRKLRPAALELRDIETNKDYVLDTGPGIQSSPFQPGQFVWARLLRVGEYYIPSGTVLGWPDRESALKALEAREELNSLNSPEGIERVMIEESNAFAEFFGSREVSLPAGEMARALYSFEHHMLFGADHPEPEKGRVPETSEGGLAEREADLTRFRDLAPGLSRVDEITAICDEFEGVVILPQFQRFKRIFLSDDPDVEFPEWRDLVWLYIKNPEIPMLAFETVAETDPQRVEDLLRILLEDGEFSIEHLYAVLLHYKDPFEGESLDDDVRSLWDLIGGLEMRSDTDSTVSAKTKSIRLAKSATARDFAKAGSKRSAKRRAGSSAPSALKAGVTKRAPASKAAKKKPTVAKKAAQNKATQSTRSKSGKSSKAAASSKKPPSKRR
jgi:hypothetical protein